MEGAVLMRWWVWLGVERKESSFDPRVAWPRSTHLEKFFKIRPINFAMLPCAWAGSYPMELVSNRGFGDVGRCRFDECPLYVSQVGKPLSNYIVETQ